MQRVLFFLVCCASFAGLTAAADVSGRWRVTISNGDNRIVGVASLEQSGEKVTGWMGPHEGDTTRVSGVMKGDRLTITTHRRPGFAVPFETCELAVSTDRMTGSIGSDGGASSTVEFVRTRQEK